MSLFSSNGYLLTLSSEIITCAKIGVGNLLHPPVASLTCKYKLNYFWPLKAGASKEPLAISFLKLSLFSDLPHLFSRRHFLCTKATDSVPALSLFSQFPHVAVQVISPKRKALIFSPFVFDINQNPLIFFLFLCLLKLP